MASPGSPPPATPAAQRKRSAALTSADQVAAPTDTTASTALVLFVSGFHLSGTTLVATAATEATAGATVTVGRLAERIPRLARFLGDTHDVPPDRSVDRLPVTPATPEEYGWLLAHETGRKSLRGGPDGAAVLRDAVADIVAECDPPVVVLKNPWDTGLERRVLREFPNARVLLVRRGVAAIEDSSARALRRIRTSNGYLRALHGDEEVDRLVEGLSHPVRHRAILAAQRIGLRLGAIRLAWTAPKLPLDRGAFLSYDELCVDLPGATAWAAHVIDPAAFARAFAAHAFGGAAPAPRGGIVARAIDRYWARAWDRARHAQVKSGMLAAPGGAVTDAPAGAADARAVVAEADPEAADARAVVPEADHPEAADARAVVPEPRAAADRSRVSAATEPRPSAGG